MKLSECKIGTLVDYNTNGYTKLGYITGFRYNVDDESIKNVPIMNRKDYIIPIVKWVDGTEYGIHHNNIKIFKD